MIEMYNKPFIKGYTKPNFNEEGRHYHYEYFAKDIIQIITDKPPLSRSFLTILMK